MSDFEKSWKGKGGIGSKLRETLRPETQLRAKINKAVYAINRQDRRLNTTLKNLRKKDRDYHRRTIDALRTHDRDRAMNYANKLAAIRETQKTINQAKLAMEQVSSRLGTVKDVGDLAATLAPVMPVIKSIGGTLSTVIPRADEEFDAIADLLGSTLADATRVSGISLDFTAANEEAEEILRQAEIQVETEMKEKLPAVPDTEEEGMRL
ncbi:MAG: Snf7 family protein [Candidatus Geothermarchaeales archaeon]